MKAAENGCSSTPFTGSNGEETEGGETDCGVAGSRMESVGIPVGDGGEESIRLPSGTINGTDVEFRRTGIGRANGIIVPSGTEWPSERSGRPVMWSGAKAWRDLANI
jgi:hypothetical protein